jgi:hypothetical protein
MNWSSRISLVWNRRCLSPYYLRSYSVSFAMEVGGFRPTANWLFSRFLTDCFFFPFVITLLGSLYPFKDVFILRGEMPEIHKRITRSFTDIPWVLNSPSVKKLDCDRSWIIWENSHWLLQYSFSWEHAISVKPCSESYCGRQ